MKYKTKKLRKNNKRKRITKRNYKRVGGRVGGSGVVPSAKKDVNSNINSNINSNKSDSNIDNQPTPQSNLEEESMKQMEELKEERNAANEAKKEAANEEANKLIKETQNVVTGSAINAVEMAGKAIGVDVTDPKEISEKLDDIKDSLTNPENIEKAKEIVGEVAKEGGIVLEAVDPLIKPLTKKVLDIGSETAVKMGDTGILLVKNAIKAIPGVGAAFVLVDDIGKISETAAATMGAAADITTQTADSVVVAKNNYEKLKSEKNEIESRVDNSKNEFLNTPLSSTEKKALTQQAPLDKKGGRKTRRKLKSKRVRFLL
jgi:hypothetical protein